MISESKIHLRLEINSNCYLQILTPEDVSSEYIRWLNDYEISKYTEQRFETHNHETVAKFVAQKYQSSSDFLFGIFFNEEHIGNIKLGPIKWLHRSAEISYIIGRREYWGKGTATSSVTRVVQFGKNKLKLEKFTAGYYENNIASAKVLAKCGFKPEGGKRSEVIFEGRRINLILVGLVASECTSDQV